jgi:hypothetical protein
MLLVREGTPELEGFLAGNFRACGGKPCPDLASSFMFPLGFEPGEKLRLRAGRYRVYILGDGGSLEVEVRLEGLEGRAVVALDERVDGSIVDGATHLPGAGIYPSGATHVFQRPALGLGVSWIEAEASSIRLSGSCTWEGGPPVPEAIAYGPLCTAAGEGAVSERLVLPPGGKSSSVEIRLVQSPPGRWGYGSYFVSLEKVQNWGTKEMWLEY